MNAQGEEIVYELSVADLQTVAREVLERQLTAQEIERVANSLSDHIGWFQAIENAIHAELE
jgi:hypothetical protein